MGVVGLAAGIECGAGIGLCSACVRLPADRRAHTPHRQRPGAVLAVSAVGDVSRDSVGCRCRCVQCGVWYALFEYLIV